MKLGAKLRYLREVEGTLRGLGRAMTQQEIVRSVKKELGKTISQSYLSQIESGARPHLTNSRACCWRDSQGASGLPRRRSGRLFDRAAFGRRRAREQLDLWLISGAERFRRDLDLHEALVTIARHEDSRMCLVLLGAIIDNPGLAERLLQCSSRRRKGGMQNDLG